MTDSKRPQRPTSASVDGTIATIGERIVVAEDGGPAGRAAVRWVADRLGRHPADIRIVGTIPRADDDAVVASRWTEVDRASVVLHTIAPSASVSADVLVGDPEDTLCAEADTADILVVGMAEDSRGRRDSLPVVLASRASCIVVVVPAEWAPEGGSTVVGASIDAASDAAIEFAADHARRAGGELRLVHAWDLPVTGEVRFPEETRDDSIPDAQRRALESFAAGVRSPGLEVSSAALQGAPDEALRAAAVDTDLLVVGRRTRRPLTRLLLGSVSRSLVLDPPCPVAVVPQPRVPLRIAGGDSRDVGP